MFLNRAFKISHNSTACGPIGLDLNADQDRMVQMSNAGGTASIRAFGAASRSLADTTGDALSLRRRIRSLLAKDHFIGRRVVTAVPAEILHIRTVRVPAAADGPSLERAALAEAAGLFPFDLCQAQVQFLRAGEVREGAGSRAEVIILAARHSELDGFVRKLDAAGTIVESLDAAPCALFRSARYLMPACHDTFAAVEIGSRSSDVVLGRGLNITFIKSIPVGWQDLDEAVSKRLDIPVTEAAAMRRRHADMSMSGAVATEMKPAPTSPRRDTVRQAVADATRARVEQLARDIAIFIRYHAVTFRGPGPSRILLLGAEGENTTLLASLSGLVRLPVVGDEVQYHAGLRRPARQIESRGRWALAIGLALKHPSFKTVAPANQPVEVACA